MTDTEKTCAVWYMRYGSMKCYLADDEDRAASFGARLEDLEEGAVVGVQFQDGRLVQREEWPAYQAARDRSIYPPLPDCAPPPPTRRVQDPFVGRVVEVDADSPQWLGVGNG